MKRIISLIIVMTVVLSMFSVALVSAGAVSYTCGDYTYTLNENSEAIITKYSGDDVDLVIPSTLDGYVVTEIGSGVFWINQTIEYVTLPEKLKKIDRDAFKLSKIVEVNFNDKLTYIGELAFYSCSKLKKVNLPDSVEFIDEQAFGGCSKLTSVKLPDNSNFTTIPNYTFADCVSLKSISIPDSVTTIGYGAFQSCHSFISVEIPSSVTSIGPEAFGYCNALTTVDMSKANITELPSGVSFGVFQDCKQLTTVTLPETEKFIAIGDHVFSGCTSLKYSKNTNTPFFIPNTVKTIGESAFEDCDSLESIEVPSGVKTLGENAFYSCDNLSDVKLNDGLRNIGLDSFGSCKSLTSIDIPDSVTTISNSAFAYSGLESIVIPDSVDTIEKSAFAGCASLKNVKLPDNEDFTIIYNGTFRDCKELTNITIPNTVTHIDANVFADSGITELTVPKSVSAVYYDFANTKSLEKITFLNSDCVIDDSYAFMGYDSTIHPNAVIYGYENSTAQTYAEKYGRTFVLLGNKPEDEITVGDADGDGEITILDATQVQLHLAQLVEFNENQLIAADTDKNGGISILDVTRIQLFLAGIITEF